MCGADLVSLDRWADWVISLCCVWAWAWLDLVLVGPEVVGAFVVFWALCSSWDLVRVTGVFS